MCPMFAREKSNATNTTDQDEPTPFRANDIDLIDLTKNLEDRVEFDRRENAFYLLRTKESNLLELSEMLG